MRAVRLIGIIVLCAIPVPHAFAQQAGATTFLGRIEGTWKLADLNVHGGSHSLDHYGPSVFAKDKWIMQTKNGDHSFELVNVNDERDPVEIAYVERDRNRAARALARLDEGRLIIARRMDWRRDTEGRSVSLPPESMEPAENTIVYTFVRSSDEVTPSKRHTIALRLTDNGRILVDRALRTFFDGRFKYPSTKRTGTEKSDSARPGTVIEGAIKENESGEARIEISIRITNNVPQDDPETSVVRSSSFFVKTAIFENRKTRIDCGDGTSCELSVE